MNVGSAIVARGKIVATPQAKQPFEMQAEEIVIEGASTADYPLQKKRHSFEYLRTISHLRPRTNTFQATFRVRSLIAYAIHTFFQERGFVYVHTPLITAATAKAREKCSRLQRSIWIIFREKRMGASITTRIFRKTDQPDGERAVERRDVCVCL